MLAINIEKCWQILAINQQNREMLAIAVCKMGSLRGVRLCCLEQFAARIDFFIKIRHQRTQENERIRSWMLFLFLHSCSRMGPFSRLKVLNAAICTPLTWA
jgi:hypothetical protein